MRYTDRAHTETIILRQHLEKSLDQLLLYTLHMEQERTTIPFQIEKLCDDIEDALNKLSDIDCTEVVVHELQF